MTFCQAITATFLCREVYFVPPSRITPKSPDWHRTAVYRKI